jgi:hypothetical protein
MLAQNLLTNDTSTATKVIIFLTDGKPTYRYDTTGYTTGGGERA